MVERSFSFSIASAICRLHTAQFIHGSAQERVAAHDPRFALDVPWQKETV